MSGAVKPRPSSRPTSGKHVAVTINADPEPDLEERKEERKERRRSVFKRLSSKIGKSSVIEKDSDETK